MGSNRSTAALRSNRSNRLMKQLCFGELNGLNYSKQQERKRLNPSAVLGGATGMRRSINKLERLEPLERVERLERLERASV
jgi:hypothetical protein